MDSPVQEDPYVALGLSREASAPEIKSAYRKLALRCHPDKVTDESLKRQKADEFHQIQQAYEILSNEESKSRFDARLRLAELKAEMMRRDGRDSRPPAQSFASYRGGQYEVRTPKFADEFTPEPRSATRKSGEAGGYSRRTSPPSVKVDEKRRSEREDKARSERRRARDADIRDSRDRKYHSSSETVNDRSHFEEERKKRDDIVKQREEAMRKAADDRRRYDSHIEETEKRRSKEAREPRVVYDDADTARPAFSIPDYLKESVDKARRYQESANYSTSRPQPVRTSSKDYYDADARRSRARPNETRRRSPEVVEPPTLNKAATTGHRDVLRAMVNEGTRMPERSYSNNVGADTHDRSAPPPSLMRHSTMPNVQTSRDSLKRDAKPSKLRPEVKIPDSGYSSPNTPTPEQVYPTVPNGAIPSTPKVSTYRYTPAGAVATDYMSASPDTYAAPYVNLETRTPKNDKDRSERRRGREGSADLPRPPMGASARSYSRDEVPRRPSYPRMESDRPRVDTDRERERGTDRRRDRDSDRRREREGYYGEVPSEYTKKNGIRTKDYREETRKESDTHMRSGRDRGYDERDREYMRPSMSRSNTIGVL